MKPFQQRYEMKTAIITRRFFTTWRIDSSRPLWARVAEARRPRRRAGRTPSHCGRGVTRMRLIHRRPLADRRAMNRNKIRRFPPLTIVFDQPPAGGAARRGRRQSGIEDTRRSAATTSLNHHGSRRRGGESNYSRIPTKSDSSRLGLPPRFGHASDEKVYS